MSSRDMKPAVAPHACNIAIIYNHMEVPWPLGRAAVSTSVSHIRDARTLRVLLRTITLLE